MRSPTHRTRSALAFMLAGVALAVLGAVLALLEVDSPIVGTAFGLAIVSAGVALTVLIGEAVAALQDHIRGNGG